MTLLKVEHMQCLELGDCPLLILLSVTTNIPTHSLIYSESFPALLTTFLVVVSSDKAGGIFWFNVLHLAVLEHI